MAKIPITGGKVPYTVSEITVMKWLQPNGTRVNEFEGLVQIDIEKGEPVLDSPANGILQIAPGMTSGTILRRPADKYGDKDDENSKWLLVFGWIDTEGEEKQPAAQEQIPSPLALPSHTSDHAAFEIQSSPHDHDDGAPRLPESAVPKNKPRSSILAAPPVWQEAQKRCIDLATVKGTGPGGRIKLSDLPIQGNAAAHAEKAVQKKVSASERPTDTPVITEPSDFVIEMTDPFETRRAIANNMELSARCIPGVPAEVHVDFRRILVAHDLLEWMDSQGEINLEPAKKYLRLEILVIEGVLRALEGEHRKLNSVWGCEDFKEFRYAKKIWASINLGIAYQRSDGLVVPVLHHMEKATYRMIGDQLFDLYDRLRENKTSKTDFARDATFTFNNVGALGSDGGASLVVHGQSVICSLHRVERNISSPFYGIGTLSASFDHRIHDGAPVVGFLVSVKRFIEQMQPLDFILHFREAMGTDL